MNIYQKYETDKQVEKDGIWLDLGDGQKIKVCRANALKNERFRVVFERKTKAMQKAMELKRVPPEVQHQIMVEVYAESIIMAWEGMTDRDGKDLPFTRENCIRLFTDLPDLFFDVQATATEIDGFRKYLVEENAKNSETSFSTTSE